jgi:hypothetical protein
MVQSKLLVACWRRAYLPVFLSFSAPFSLSLLLTYSLTPVVLVPASLAPLFLVLARLGDERTSSPRPRPRAPERPGCPARGERERPGCPARGRDGALRSTMTYCYLYHILRFRISKCKPHCKVIVNEEEQTSGSAVLYINNQIRSWPRAA